VAWDQATNRHRDRHEGNHPGYVLARRLAAKAEQAWTFTRHSRKEQAAVQELPEAGQSGAAARSVASICGQAMRGGSATMGTSATLSHRWSCS
jgi:hypothetical protein